MKKKLLQFIRIKMRYVNLLNESIESEKTLDKLIDLSKELSIYYASFPSNISPDISILEDIRDIEKELIEYLERNYPKKDPEKLVEFIKIEIEYFSDLYIARRCNC